MKINELKCAVFDLDGTLIDSMPMWHTIGERYLKSKGITPKEGLWDNVKRLTLTQTGSYLRDNYTIEDDEQAICSDINLLTYKAYSEEIMPKEGAVELLKLLNKKHIPCVVATATHKDCVMACLNRLDILKYFNSVYSCIDYNTTKASPYIYELACRTVSCKNSETVVFEDAVHAGRTAKKAGFYLAACFDESSLELTEPPLSDWEYMKEIADISVMSLNEIIRLLD